VERTQPLEVSPTLLQGEILGNDIVYGVCTPDIIKQVFGKKSRQITPRVDTSSKYRSLLKKNNLFTDSSRLFPAPEGAE
jgi:hypothetical protein